MKELIYPEYPSIPILENSSVIFTSPGKEVMMVQHRPTNTLYFLCSYTGDIEEEWQLPYDRRSLMRGAAVFSSLEEAKPTIERMVKSIQQLRETINRN